MILSEKQTHICKKKQYRNHISPTHNKTIIIKQQKKTHICKK